MNRRLLACSTIVGLSVLLMACPKKPPKTNPEDMTTKTTTVAPQPTEVTQPTHTAPVVDKTPDPLSGDLQNVNSYVQAQGLVGKGRQAAGGQDERKDWFSQGILPPASRIGPQ